MPDSLLALLRSPRPGRRVRLADPPSAAAAPVADPLPPAAEPPIRACGWFDSSHELRQGLVVDESPSPSALAQAPLEAWLAWELQGWRPALPPDPADEAPPVQA